MTIFKHGNVALDDTAEAFDFDRMRSQVLVMVILQRYDEKEPCQECDDDNAESGSRQELEMKMLWTKKPGDGSSSENPSAYLRG